MGSENRQELERLESTLTQSDPALAGKYGIFNRLAEDEPFARAEPPFARAEPVPERVASASPDGIPYPRPALPGPAAPDWGAPVPSPGEHPDPSYTMEPRTSERDHRIVLLCAWLLPLLMLISIMLPMLIAVLVAGSGH
jgi:hypothetical protein